MAKTTSDEARDKVKPSPNAHNFPFLGIGASGEGIDAFRQMPDAIHLNSGMAYVVVKHLNPSYESDLTEILLKLTKNPIQEITDEVKILPNHIYVMPDGKILSSVDGVLKLALKNSEKTNLVIDIFLLPLLWFGRSCNGLG